MLLPSHHPGKQNYKHPALSRGRTKTGLQPTLWQLVATMTRQCHYIENFEMRIKNHQERYSSCPEGSLHADILSRLKRAVYAAW
jgi:hypothetical protein